MQDAMTVAWIREKYVGIAARLDERSRRRWAAVEAGSLGWGGVTAVAQATGLTRKTIHIGLDELKAEEADPSAALATDRIRRPGAGRKPLTQHQPKLVAALNALVEPTARGDPGAPLRWTCLSTSHLSTTLRRRGFAICPRKVSALLKQNGYSLQANRKRREGAAHPDRNAQFEYINTTAATFLRQRQPVISVDTKKKELVGDFKNAGREWQPAGKPVEVLVHDFPDPKTKKAIPYGVYDLGRNEGWVSVGIDHDTARFAAATIRRWWMKMGRGRYPKARKLLITADCGGSNSSRTRLWKVALQDLADATGLRLTVCHFPPGTSKWNKIEHRMFCHITQNWRGRPLTSYAAIVQLIGRTTTRTGLRIRSELDRHAYPLREEVTPEQLARVTVRPAAFHGEWNYSILPKQ
jgi:hypothetical protein